MITLDHVGVRVTDLDVAVRFYSELLGLEMLERRTRIDPHEGEVEAAAMKVNDGAWIFLLRTPKVQSHVESIEGRPEHFCLVFQPDEFARVIDRLEESGTLARMDCALQPRTGATGRTVSRYILDPDNNVIEVKSL